MAEKLTELFHCVWRKKAPVPYVVLLGLVKELSIDCHR